MKEYFELQLAEGGESKGESKQGKSKAAGLLKGKREAKPPPPVKPWIKNVVPPSKVCNKRLEPSKVCNKRLEPSKVCNTFQGKVPKACHGAVGS